MKVSNNPTYSARTLVSLLIIFMLILFFITIGVSIGRKSSQDNEENLSLRTPIETCQQTLHISAVPAQDAYTVFSLETRDGTQSELVYYNLEDVVVQLNGIGFTLETALRDGKTSISELTSWARTDAQNGFCTETAETVNGLTQFLYHYNEFNLYIIYDVLETPDGGQHLIQSFRIHPPYSDLSLKSINFTDAEGNLITREDWGLTFEVAEVTATSITLNCTQSGGQQIGQLKTYSYILDSDSEQKCLTAATHEVDIEADATTFYILDWSDNCGDLPSGTYSLSIEVCDNYDESQMHPLMRNYHDRQWYTISFDIP